MSTEREQVGLAQALESFFEAPAPTPHYDDARDFTEAQHREQDLRTALNNYKEAQGG